MTIGAELDRQDMPGDDGMSSLRRCSVSVRKPAPEKKEFP
jgi:hypothetical protein